MPCEVNVFPLSPSIRPPWLLQKKGTFTRSCWLNRRSKALLTLSIVRIWPLTHHALFLNTQVLISNFIVDHRTIISYRNSWKKKSLSTSRVLCFRTYPKLNTFHWCLTLCFLSPVQAAVMQVNEAVSAQDQAALLAALQLEALALLGVQESHCNWYLEHFTTYCQQKSKVYWFGESFLDCFQFRSLGARSLLFVFFPSISFSLF